MSLEGIFDGCLYRQASCGANMPPNTPGQILCLLQRTDGQQLQRKSLLDWPQPSCI